VSTHKTLQQYLEIRHRRISMIELLVTLVLMMIVTPFLENFRYGGILEVMLLTLVLIMAVVAIGVSSRMRNIAIILAIPAVAGKWISHFRPDLLPVEVSLLAGMLFVGFVIVHLLRFTLSAPRVDIEVLSAAISNFLMIGLFWVFAYDLAALMVPDSFVFSTGPAASHTMNGFNGFYFSFVTLSTIGYGDITPLSPVARMLAIVEAIVGMFYMTVLVARLVAMYSAGRTESS
jgi:hypothetical protein